MHPTVFALYQTLTLSSGTLTPVAAEAALELLRLPSNTLLDVLALGQIVRSRTQPRVFTCGIVNAKSGLCYENCAFCAQSAHYKTGVSVYPLIEGETLLKRAEDLAKAGVARFGIVTSGSRLIQRDLDALCEAAHRIRKCVDIALCASLGQIDASSAYALKEAGFSRYHHNLETAASFFPSICTTHDYSDSIATIRTAQDAGLSACSGGIFGLGEGPEHIIELSQTLADLAVDAIPVNFLMPISGTPLEHSPLLDAGYALRIIAVLRLMHPSRDILICGGREKILGALQSLVFAAGASGVMTGNYLTTTGCMFDADNRLLAQLGLRQE